MNVTVLPGAHVTLGSTVTFRCQYARVTETSKLVVRWDYEALNKNKTDTILIWKYSTGEGDFANHKNEGHFVGLDSNITSVHSIKIHNVRLADEGHYNCQVEEFIDGKYIEGNDFTDVTILGKTYQY